MNLEQAHYINLMKFKFCEGSNIIGTGIILEILNKNLEL